MVKGLSQRLWRTPQLRVSEAGEDDHRHATWLELFFDLVFVAAIAELAHNLSGEISLAGFSGFVVLFIPVWWSWVGAAFYASRFDCDNDLGHRLLTLLQMVLVAVMAVNLHYGLGETSVGFALSYAAVRTVTVLEYLRAGYYIPIVRPLTSRYAIGFGVAIVLWITSVFVPIPWRYTFWIAAIIVDLGVPRLWPRLIARFPPHVSHIPERMGLFTIIVLGEAVLAVVKSVSQQQWTIASALAAVLGLSIAFSLWWLYFDTVDGSPLRGVRAGRVRVSLIWLYAHLPLVIGLAATGVAVEHVISHDSRTPLLEAERWLLCGSVALCLVALAGIHLITCTLGNSHRRKILATYRVTAATLIIGLAIVGTNLLPVTLTTIVAIVCASQVAFDLRERLRQPVPRSLEETGVVQSNTDPS